MFGVDGGRRPRSQRESDYEYRRLLDWRLVGRHRVMPNDLHLATLRDPLQRREFHKKYWPFRRVPWAVVFVVACDQLTGCCDMRDQARARLSALIQPIHSSSTTPTSDLQQTAYRRRRQLFLRVGQHQATTR